MFTGNIQEPHVSLGELRERAVLQQLQRKAGPDEEGQAIEEWANVGEIAFKAEWISGREITLPQGVKAENAYRLTARYRPGISTKMQLVWRGEIWNIHSAPPLSRRRFMFIFIYKTE